MEDIITIYADDKEFVIYNPTIIEEKYEPDRTSDEDFPYTYINLEYSSFTVYQDENDITKEYKYLPDDVIEVAIQTLKEQN